jgi:hypothetical protein
VALLHAPAPTQAEPPFAVAQGALFLLFLVATGLSVVRFPGPRPVRSLRTTALS